MTKTFEEFIDPLVWETSLVGDKIYFQDENTPDEECYWLSYKDAIKLLKLVREQTIKEIIELDKVLYYDHYEEYSVNGISVFDVQELSKDSIKL